jgi:hypothetical protein
LELNGVSDENRLHIFWECDVVQKCIKSIYMIMWGRDVISKNEFLMGKVAACREIAIIYQLCNIFIRYRIWNYKIANILPKSGSIANDLNILLNRFSEKPQWRGMLPLACQLLSA